MSSSRPAGRWRRAVVGLALVASPVLVACGGDGGGQPTDAPASTQAGDGDQGDDGGGSGGGNEDEPDENEPDEDEQGGDSGGTGNGDENEPDENEPDENEQDEG